MTDYNGVAIPTKVSSEDVMISVSIRYTGKYGTPELFQIEDCSLEDWVGIEETIQANKLEIEYSEEK